MAHQMPAWRQALVYLRIVMGLSVFSIAGNLLRIKLVNSLAGFQERQHLGDIGNPFPDFAPNLLGCFVIGLAFQTKDRWFEAVFPGSSTFKDWSGSSSLYVAIATWFCGSLTTYSSWNTVVTHRFLAGPQLWAVSTAFLGAATAYIALLFGMDVGSGFERVTPQEEQQQAGRRNGEAEVELAEKEAEEEGGVQKRKGGYVAGVSSSSSPGPLASLLVGLDPVMADLLLYTLLGVATVVLVCYQNDLEAWSCLFAPLGASVRWGLSLLLPKVAEWMPWRGTWAAGLPMHTWMANVLGSILSALFRVLSLEAHWRGAKMAELMCKALSLGLCGCLSTYSTLSLEVFRLPSTRAAYRYMGLTFLASQAASLLIMGTYQHAGRGGFP